MQGQKREQLLEKMKQKYGSVATNRQKESRPKFVSDSVQQQNYLYDTPIKSDRIIAGQTLSSTMTRIMPFKLSNEQKTESFAEKSIQKRMTKHSDKDSRGFQRQMQPCFGKDKSETINGLRDKLLEKEKIIVDRVRQNQKALTLSKQLRNQQRSNKSQQRTPDVGQNYKPADAKFQNYLSTRMDKTEGYRYNQSVRKPEKDICAVIEQAEATFREKMDRIMQKRGGKQNLEDRPVRKQTCTADYKSKTDRECQAIAEFPRQERQPIPELSRQQRQNFNFAFHNTSKIHERIQALLHSR